MAEKWTMVTIRNKKAARSTSLYHPPSDDDPKTIVSNLSLIFDFQPHDPQFKTIEVSSELVDDITMEKGIKVVFENEARRPDPTAPGIVQRKPSRPYQMTLYHPRFPEYPASRIEQIIRRNILVLPSDSPIKVTTTKPENT